MYIYIYICILIYIYIYICILYFATLYPLRLLAIKVAPIYENNFYYQKTYTHAYIFK